ncbi:hypothetical protein KI387_008336 [Taxus chinensis]|uniref:Uncharacterized protein n=1 Tax=Taxus chinensis TaxID=29808 RepID=A0AA38CQF0_TAXCH|nr:hypothetical protein KI387_008336 [Taxus chinensis]
MYGDLVSPSESDASLDHSSASIDSPPSHIPFIVECSSTPVATHESHVDHSPQDLAIEHTLPIVASTELIVTHVHASIHSPQQCSIGEPSSETDVTIASRAPLHLDFSDDDIPHTQVATLECSVASSWTSSSSLQQSSPPTSCCDVYTFLSNISLIEQPHWDEYLPDLSCLFADSTCVALQEYALIEPSHILEDPFISLVGSAHLGTFFTSTISEMFHDPPLLMDPFVRVIGPPPSSLLDMYIAVALSLSFVHTFSDLMPPFSYRLDAEIRVLHASSSFVEWADFQCSFFVLPKGRNIVWCRRILFSLYAEDHIIDTLLRGPSCPHFFLSLL